MIGLILLLIIAATILLIGLSAVCAHTARMPPRRAAGWALAHSEPVSPEDKGIPYSEWTLDRPNGAQICIWDVPGKNPDAPVMVMLHGWSRSKLTWLVRLDWWQARSSRLLIPDLRGHGDSTPDGSTLGQQDAEDIAAILERADVKEVVLVGRSLGSVVAIFAGALLQSADPKSVLGVIAVSPYERLAHTIRARLKQRSLPTVPIVRLGMLFLKMRGLDDPSTRKAAEKLSCPVLVIQGDADPISNPADAERISNAVHDSTLIMVEGAGHGDHWDLEKERLDEAVESFLMNIHTTRQT